MKHCTNCGKPIQGTNFCRSCGFDLRRTQTKTPQQATPQQQAIPKQKKSKKNKVIAIIGVITVLAIGGGLLLLLQLWVINLMI